MNANLTQAGTAENYTEHVVTTMEDIEGLVGRVPGLLSCLAEAEGTQPGGTEVYMIRKQTEPSALQVISLRDGHNRTGHMTFSILTQSPGSDQWLKHNQDMYTAFLGRNETAITPTQDTGNIVNSSSSIPSGPTEFPINPPDRPARHLAAAFRINALNTEAPSPTAKTYDHTVGSVIPEQWHFTAAKSMMDILNAKITSLGRAPSWRGWEIASGSPVSDDRPAVDRVIDEVLATLSGSGGAGDEA